MYEYEVARLTNGQQVGNGVDIWFIRAKEKNLTLFDVYDIRLKRWLGLMVCPTNRENFNRTNPEASHWACVPQKGVSDALFFEIHALPEASDKAQALCEQLFAPYK